MDEVRLLPVLPWTAAVVALVLVVALNVPVPRPAQGPPPGRPLLAGGAWTTARIAAPVVLAVVAVLVVLSRIAGATEVDNPVPALVVGLLWPALLVLPALAWPVLRRAAGQQDGAPRDVRPAVVAAAALVGYLTLVPQPTEPRRLGTALAAYAAAALAVGIGLGRPVAARTEALGLLTRWSALGPAVVRWQPPRGAAAVLVVVLGGAWAERFQRTTSWAEQVPGRGLQLGLLVVCVGVAAAAAAALARTSAGAAPLLLPLTAAALLAGVLRRAVISAQLLWDSVGPGAPGITPDPLGVVGSQASALAVTAVGGVLAAVVAARRSGPGTDRLPATAVAALVTAVTAVVALTP